MCICSFYVKHASLSSKSKDGLAWNQDNVSGVELHVYQQTWASTIKIQFSMLI